MFLLHPLSLQLLQLWVNVVLKPLIGHFLSPCMDNLLHVHRTHQLQQDQKAYYHFDKLEKIRWNTVAQFLTSFCENFKIGGCSRCSISEIRDMYYKHYFLKSYNAHFQIDIIYPDIDFAPYLHDIFLFNGPRKGQFIHDILRGPQQDSQLPRAAIRIRKISKI